MRNTKVKQIRKGLAIAGALMFFAVGSSAFADAWDDFKSNYSTNATGSLSSNVTATGTGVTFTAPVPGSASKYTLNGNGNTISTSSTLAGSVINNEANVTTDVNNTHFTGSYRDLSTNGGAVSNSGTMNISGSTTGGVTITTDSNGNKTFSYDTSKFDTSYQHFSVTGNGGAVENTGTMTIKNTLFGGANASEGNQAKQNADGNGFGGAIDSNGTSLTIQDSAFLNNSTDGFAGAVANRNGVANIERSIFVGNSTTSTSPTLGIGGAVLNGAEMTITNSGFSSNVAGNYGGAIANALTTNGGANDTSSTLTINDVLFDANSATNGGGAVYNSGTMTGDTTHTLVVNGGTFQYNTASANNAVGGAIFNNGANSSTGDGNVAEATLNNVTFYQNSAAQGGAIRNNGKMVINNSVFDGNGSYNGVNAVSGGAISNVQTAIYGTSDTNLTISNSTFKDNVSTTRGGAIHNTSSGGEDHKATVTIIDSVMTGNYVNDTSATAESGGAIWAGNNSITNIKASNGGKTVIGVARMTEDEAALANASTDTISFSGNAIGNFDAAQNGVVEINSTVRGDRNNGGVINVNQNSGSTGVVHFKGYGGTVTNADLHLYNGELQFDHDASLGATNNLTMYGGTLNLLNGEILNRDLSGQLFVDNFTLAGNANMKLDVDLANKTMDGIYTGTNPDGVKNVNNVSNPDGYNLHISEMYSKTQAQGDNTRILFTDAPELIGHVTSTKELQTPIYKYSVKQETINNPSTSGGGADPGNGEYFIFNRIGNSDSVIAGPVAAQAAFLLMDNLYRQSFANMDMVTLMTPEQRMAWKMRNKYASAYHTGVFAPNIIPEERDGFYVRPFSNFENVPLKNGPRVSNVSYGTLVGGDSDIIELGHGWDANYSFFGAYHGSHQAYNGVSIWQNGGTIGGVATAYKGNFWTGVTANVGASAAQASHNFGSDQFPILMTGAAWKSGYNWGLFNNKMVIQPSYMMSYTFVNVFDYTNSAGVKVSQDPLNAIEIIPGLRIIGNLKNGWQPYLGVNMTWNIMDRTKFYANEVALTELSVKPYVEYGVGLQKRYGDRFTGFGQAMLRNGGRNGIALTLGLRWALGH